MARRSRDRTRQSWIHMIDRCHNPNSDKYRNYGQRGIYVCPEWRHSYDTFLDQMGPRPEGTTLDRIDNDKGYYLANCRWADPVTQSRNSINAVMLTYLGETHSLSEWSELLGINPNTVRIRYWRGYTVEQVLSVTKLRGK